MRKIVGNGRNVYLRIKQRSWIFGIFNLYTHWGCSGRAEKTWEVDLRLPAKIGELELEKGMQHNLLTRNICSGGAFFETKKHLLTENSRVSIDVVVPTGVQIKVADVVLRSEPTGVALRFDNEYQMILPVKNSHKSNKFYNSSPSIH